MKNLRTMAASVACLLLMACHAMAATATVIIRVAPGPSYTGLASSVLVTVYDNTHTALVTASNTPDGTHSFAEEGSTGSYWALYSVDTTKLPLSFTTTITSTSLVFPPTIIGTDRAIQIADGYTSGLATGQATTNTQAAKLQFDGSNNVKSAPQTAVTLSGTPSVNAVQWNGTAITGGLPNTVPPANPTDYARNNVLPSWISGDPFALINPLIAAGRFTTAALSNAPTGSGGGSDPWATALPGSYSAGTAGYILGHNLDAQVSGVPTAIANYNVGGSAGTLTHRVADAISASIQGGSYLSGALNTSSHQQTVVYYIPGTTLAAMNAGTAVVVDTAVITYATDNKTILSRVDTPGTF